MIDTVEIILNNAYSKHIGLWQLLQRDDEGLLVQDRILPWKTAHQKNTSLGRRIISEEDSGVKERLRLHTRKIPSSHYEIVIMMSKDRDFIKFNFSIPKYFYGTNIIQSVQNPNERDFIFTSDLDNFEYQKSIGYSRLKKYIKMFFKREFPLIDIDYTCVQIVRLDFAFNQIFSSKDEALHYLDIQKNIHRRYERETSGNGVYDTAKFFSSKDFSCKIYHKGTEYSKNDRKEHEKINRNYQKDIFPVQKLQDFSDRILRYEVTIRNSHLSYFYNQKCFRKNSDSFQILKKLYNKLKYARTISSEQDPSLELYYKKIDEIISDFEKKSILKYPKDLISHLYDIRKKQIVDYVLNQEQKRFTLEWFYDRFDELITTSRKFYLELPKPYDYEWLNDFKSNENLFLTLKDCAFGSSLYEVCVDFLRYYFNENIVKKFDSTDEYIKRIHAYNRKVDYNNSVEKSKISIFSEKKFRKKNKLDINKMSLLIESVRKHPLKELKRKYGWNDRTYYRYQSDLKKIGIDKNTRTDPTINSPELSFQEYYDYLIKNRELFISDRVGDIFY